MSPYPVAEAFRVARTAQRRWSQRPVARRCQILRRYHDLVLDHQEELLDLIQAETGKTRMDAFHEVMDVAITARHYSFRAPRTLRQRRVNGALPLVTATRVDVSPIGVVGVIAAWNYPLTLALSDALAALVAGNGVVLKPASATPRTARRAAELLYEAGLPRDLLRIVEGPGATVGQEVARQADYLMFTGSTEVGAQLGKRAGERLIGYSAELGGKNPLIVCSDADPEAAARGALGACFSNSGQLCVSIERIYVHEAVADAFIAAFQRQTEQMRLGHGWNDTMGSLISTDHVERVAAYVDDAVAQGARVLTGGRRLPELGPTFYAPTILLEVPRTAKLYREEVFGPVVYIERVESHAQGIIQANDTSYGLNASVWGEQRTALGVARQLECGTVNINEGFAAAWASIAAPMGGWKRSGVGRRHGDVGLLKYTESRTIATQRWGTTITPLPEWAKPQRAAATLTRALKLGKYLLR